MSRVYSYLKTAVQILQLYEGAEPFAAFLKKYFSLNKKMGSRDRKQIAHLCYCFFRAGTLKEKSINEENILAGLFLCSSEPNEILQLLKPEWNSKTALKPEEKLELLHEPLSAVFPWKEHLSATVEYELFCNSFFVQPDLFLRIRPGKNERVKEQLKKSGIGFNVISEQCLSVPNTTKITSVLDSDQDVIIQDLNSQQVGQFIGQALAAFSHEKPAVWDCCAGSGGKSIMTYDLYPHIELTVSDVRESILSNLRKRFEKAGINRYTSFVTDLTSQHPIPDSGFQLILCDAPCSGSGTWSRTPEQKYFFDYRRIDAYASLQKNIVATAISRLEPGGTFIYITCSVFRKENEEVVAFIKDRFHLKINEMQLLKGYASKADSLFVAVFNS